MQFKGTIANGLLIALALTLIPISAYGTNHAGPKTPSCGNYKVTKNEAIVGVKFPKGIYQINTFGISCAKVMGSKGLFSKFLKLKNKDPLPKPWRYLADAVGAPKFSSGPGVGFRVQLLTSTPIPIPSATPQPEPSATKISFTPWATSFAAEDMVAAALAKTSESLGDVKPSSSYTLTVDPLITASDREWITKMLDYTNGAFSDVLQGRVKIFLGTNHDWSASTLRSAGTWVGDPGSPYPCSNGINDAYCAGTDIALLIYSDIYKPNSTYRWDVGRRSTPAHELFHNVQFALGGRNVGPNEPTHIPRWLMEGSANYFGFYVADRLGFDQYQTGRNQQVNTNPAYKTIVPLVQYDNFTSNPYGIGQAASEYLIASVGFEKFLNIWKFTKSESSFTEGFKKATGITIEDFYSKFETARSSMRIGS